MILQRNLGQNMAKPFTCPKFGISDSQSASPGHNDDSFNLQSLILSDNQDESSGVLQDLDRFERQKIEEAIITGWIEEAEKQDQLYIQTTPKVSGSRTSDRNQADAPSPDFSFSRRVAQHLMGEFPQATFGWLCRAKILPDIVTPDVLREHARALVARIQFVKNNPG